MAERGVRGSEMLLESAVACGRHGVSGSIAGRRIVSVVGE